MNQAKSLILAVIVAVGLAALNGRSASFPDAWAKKLDLSIREVCPEAQIQASNNVFTAKHGTMMFMLYKTAKRGEIYTETYQTEAPNFRGFLLTVGLHPGRYQGAAMIPQTLQGPYFPTFIDAPVAEDGQGYYSVRFSYGDALDEKIRNAIFAAIPRTVFPRGAADSTNAVLGTDESPISLAEVSATNTSATIAAAKDRGAANAAKDIEAGRLRVFHFGKPWPVETPLVDDATGYRVQILEGCVVTEGFAAEVTAYNETMRQWHRENRAQQAVGRRSFAFQRVALSKAQRQNLDAAMRTMTFQRKGDSRCDSLEDAASLLWRSISIAIAAPRAAAEYGEFFVFSRLDWAKDDDSSFLSGFAVKKGTGEIYSWEENKLATMPDLAKPTAADEKQVIEIRNAAQEWWPKNRGLLAEESFRVAGFFHAARAIPGFAVRDDRVWEVRVIHLNTTPTGVLWVNERTKKVASLSVEATNAVVNSRIGTAQLGDGLPKALPRYEMVLIAEQVAFDSASNVAFRVLIRNLGAEPIPAPDVIWGLSVVLDGKEYNREPLHLGVWNGRSEIIPKGVFAVGRSLSEFAIPAEALAAGRHTILLKDSVAESNALTVFIAPTSSDHPPENHEVDPPH